MTYLFDGSFYWNAPWMESFWNGRINRVAVLLKVCPEVPGDSGRATSA